MRMLTSVYCGVESTPGPLLVHMTWAGGLLSEMQDRLRVATPSSSTRPPSTRPIRTVGLSGGNQSKPPSWPILTENVQGDKGAVLPVPVGDVPDQALQALAQVCLGEGVLEQRLAPGGGDGERYEAGGESPPFVGARFTTIFLNCGRKMSSVQDQGD